MFFFYSSKKINKKKLLNKNMIRNGHNFGWVYLTLFSNKYFKNKVNKNKKNMFYKKIENYKWVI